MRTQIIDKNALQAIAPLDLIAYLRSKGAIKQGDFAHKATIWSYDNEELLVPRLSQYADYALSLAQILRQIESIEQRSQLAILNDIKHTGYDIIRVRNVSNDTKDGTLNFTKSVEFIAHTRDMLLAAACSASTQKLVYPSKKPQVAENFMNTVRFGQTERGSFVLTMLAPVSPDLSIQGTLIEMEEELPYEKKVIPTLGRGLVALNSAAEATIEDNTVEHFTNAVNQGITSNLCDAVVGMYDKLTPDHIEVSIAYSTNRKTLSPFPSITVNKDYIPIIREASSAIKLYEPEEEQTIRGWITNLGFETNEEFGLITVKDIFSPKPRKITIQLPRKEYFRAVTAHQDTAIVEFSGDIIKFGRNLRLTPSSPFKIVPRDIEQ